jgi:hypothetical protein
VGIVNHSPAPNEPGHFAEVRDEKTKQISATYALFSVLRGLSPGHKIFSSAGLSTQGTWSAIDFFTSSRGLAELMKCFGVAKPSALPEYFQAIVKVEIVKGEPANTSAVLPRAVDDRSNAAP